MQYPFQSSDSGLGSDSSGVHKRNLLRIGSPIVSRLPERDKIAREAAIALRIGSPIVSHLPERNKTAWEAAIALVGKATNPLSRNTHHNNEGHASSIGDSSGSSSSKSSDLFIPRRAKHHMRHSSRIYDSSSKSSDLTIPHKTLHHHSTDDSSGLGSDSSSSNRLPKIEIAASPEDQQQFSK